MSLDLFRALGFIAEKTEYWNSFTSRRHDLFNFGDILAFNDMETALIQSTSTSNINSRIKKIKENPISAFWLTQDNDNRTIYVIGWKKYSKPINRKYWRPTIKKISFQDDFVITDVTQYFFPVDKDIDIVEPPMSDSE